MLSRFQDKVAKGCALIPSYTPGSDPSGQGGGGGSFPDFWSNVKYYLAFDGDATDGSDAPITFTVNGSPTYPSGKWSKCINCDGSTDFLSVAQDSSWNLGANDAFTVAYWYRTDGAGGDKCVMEIGNFGSGGCLMRHSSTNRLQCAFQGQFSESDPSTLPNDTTWRHVAMVRNTTGALYMYLDGVLIDTTPSNADKAINAATATDIRIGRANHNNADWFNGRIDDLMWVPGYEVWTEAFTPPTGPHNDLSSYS